MTDPAADQKNFAKGDSDRSTARPWNPLSVDPVASQFSSYAAFNGTSVTRPFAPPTAIDTALIDAHCNSYGNKLWDSFSHV